MSYFFWLQEKIHQSIVFSKIETGHGIAHAKTGSVIQLTIQDPAILPVGYQWQEQGREFSYKGMFYDIYSIEKTKFGWVIRAAADEEEAAMVDNQQKAIHLDKATRSNAKSPKIKLNVSVALYLCPQINQWKARTYLEPQKRFAYSISPILSVYLGKILQPPEII